MIKKMENIIITNTISEDKIYINFDLQDGQIPFPSFEMSTIGDIELNPLILKLTELIELKRKINFQYVDANSLIIDGSKTKLIKETLDEIYESFNSNVSNEFDDEF